MLSASQSLAVYIINGWVVVWDVHTNRDHAGPNYFCTCLTNCHLPLQVRYFLNRNKSIEAVLCSLTDIWRGKRFNKALYWQAVNWNQLIRTSALERDVFTASSLYIRRPTFLNHRLKSCHPTFCLDLNLYKWNVVKLKRGFFFSPFLSLASPSSSCVFREWIVSLFLKVCFF